jgi:hypothetical protein
MQETYFYLLRNNFMNETLTGNWTISAEAMGQPIEIEMNLTQNGENITGKLNSILGEGTIEDGKINENNLSGTIKISFQGQPVELKMSGIVDGDSMKGTLGSPFGEIPFTAKKLN